MNRVLPPELTDRIIDFLWNYPSVLCRCALTCHAWHPRSILYLYDHIQISSKDGFDALAAMVRRCPRVAAVLASTRTIRLHDTTLKWIHQIPCVLGRICPNVTTLRLIGIDFKEIVGLPDPLHIGFPQFKNVTSLDLNRSTFRNLQQLQRLVYAFPMLESLSLIAIDFVNEVLDCCSIPAARPDCAIALKHLALSSIVAYDWILCTPTKYSLRSLQLLLWSTEEAAHFAALIPAVAPQLEDMYLYLNRALSAKDAAALNVDQCVAVRSWQTDANPTFPFTTVLRLIPPRSRLRTCTLRSYSDELQAWGKVWDALSDARFSELEEITFKTYRRSSYSQADYERGTDDMGQQELLRRLRSRGVRAISAYYNIYSLVK